MADVGGETGIGRLSLIINFIVFQAAWFACIVAAAHHQSWLGTLAVIAAIGWHLGWEARRTGDVVREAKLIASALVIGTVFDSLVVALGVIRYADGQFDPNLPPHWIIALWGLLAITLNVSLRWLKRRWLLAAALGAIAAPLSYAAGVRLGAAQFVDAREAFVVLAVGWALLMPLMMWLSDRYDGMRPARRVAHA